MKIYDPTGADFDTVLLASSKNANEYREGNTKDH